MARKRLPALHPGEAPREEFLVPLSLSALAAARACGAPRARIERLARAETGVSGGAAVRLAAYFGATPEFWMNLQSQCELETARATVGADAARIKRRRAAAA
jgi:addiction module HigA family antidote